MSLHTQDKIVGMNNNNSSKASKHKDGEWKWFYDNNQLGELGFYKNNKKDSLWKWYFKNGELKAIGNYKNGQPVGHRKWYYSHGDVYCVGQYNLGKRDGLWKLYSSGDKLRSTIKFKNDTVITYTIFDKEGEIILKNKGNDKTKVIFDENYSYLGVFDFRIEDIDGYRVNISNSEIYIKNYKNNTIEGESRIYSLSGKLNIIRNYKKGKLHGEFQQFNDNADLAYSWNYKKGKQIGLYTEYYDNGQAKNIGYLKNDLQVGKWKLYHENGQIQNRRTYKNGKLTGKEVNYHNNGKLESKGNYFAGNRNGQWVSYYKNGELKSKENYLKGVKEGVWSLYHENGKLKEIVPYKNNKIHGVWTIYNDEGILTGKTQINNGNFKELHKTFYHSNGQISAIGNTDGIGNNYGEWKYYYENGSLKEINNYKDGKEDGKNIKYYKNGQLKFEGQHIEGDRYGKFIWYKEDGKIKEAIELQRDSKYEIALGKWKYYDNGQLKSVELYRREELVEWKYYYDNGQIKELKQFYKQKRTGAWKYYYKSGELRRLANYNNDMPQGEFKLYHKNGQLYKTQIWKNNRKLIEINSCFDANGNTLDIGTLKAGAGIVNEYDANGNLINKVEYIKGRPINNKSIDDIWLDDDALNSIAWKIFEEDDDTEKLNFAIKWIEQSIQLNENYYNTDTYAALLYKTGNHKQALLIANKAIEIAKKNNINYGSTKRIIDKITKQ